MGAGPRPTIRRMTGRDLRAVMEIERLCFPAPWDEEVFLEELEREWAHLDVLAVDGVVLGFVNFWLVRDEVHVLNVAVHPSARRSGWASRLLAHVIAVAWREGCHLIALEVRRSNQSALRLYRKFAFRPVGIRPGYYAENNEDAIVMLLERPPSATAG